ncbi:MAG: HNH endonuclease [Anaerolinea sp.]|nr:HNH endonuclease [Anaerolinea sp.]
MFQTYLHRFTHLHTAANRTHWTEATCFRAPNKPLLLLAVLDQFAQGNVSGDLIELTPELGELFAGYWSRIMPPHRHGNIAMPFFHLRADRFWHLVARPGQEQALAALITISSIGQVRTVLLGARLDDDLAALLRQPEPREALRRALVETYFAAELQARLLEQGLVNVEAYRYGEELLAQAPPQVLKETPEQYRTAVRDQGFRRVIVSAYDHRCAFCGIRMLTIDGHTAVDAAHIVPWSVSHNDDPCNGMALCRLCHWTFDEGLLGVSARYAVLLGRQLAQSPNVAGHLLTLALRGRPIIGPGEQSLWPDLDALAWHRREVLR